MELGSHVRINMGSVLVLYSRITIGNDCLIGEYVSIREGDHKTYLKRPTRLQDHHSEPIAIDNNVWIGQGAVILKGVKIGTGAIIAAHSVVTKDVPENTIVAGVPARVVRQRGESTRS